MSGQYWRIKDWEKHFENNRTRDLHKMAWVPIPNKMDGDGYTELLDHPDGPSHFAAWIAIVEIASRCTFYEIPQAGAGEPQAGAGELQAGVSSPSQRRGKLIREGGRPHNEQSLSRLSRIPESVFKKAIPRLIGIGWMESVTFKTNNLHIETEIPQVGAGEPQVGAGEPQAGAGEPQAGVILTRARGTERNGIEENTHTVEKTTGSVANGNENHVRVSDSYLSDESFKPFIEVAIKLWPDLIPEDLQISWNFTWRKWDFEQRLDCVRRTQARIDAGEDGRYVTRPPKYLESGNWKRPPRLATQQETAAQRYARRIEQEMK